MFLCVKNADLYAPEHLGKRDILICNDKVIAVKETIGTLPEGCRVIDAAGRKVIPGLIDQHVHVTGGGGESGFTSRVPEIQLSDIVKAGVTTVVGLLGTDSRTRSVQNLLAKTKALNEEGITAFCLTGAYEVPSPTLTGSVGDDIMFLQEVIGVKVAISDHRSSNMSREDMVALASEARIAGLLSKKPGVVHMHTGVGKQGLKMILEILETTDIPVKVFRPTHMRKMLDEDVLAFTALGGYADYTASDDPDKKAAEIMETLEKGVPAHLATPSSDSHGSMPKWGPNKEIIGITAAKMTSLFTQIKSFVKLGMPLEEAILFVTKNVAEALEVYPRKGCIRENSDGDLVILGEDLAIETVVAKGQIMMEEGTVVKKGLFED